MSSPSLGFFLHNVHIATSPAVAVEVAQLAEELGYDSLWAGEHVVVPRPRVPPSPMEPDEPILDPLILLAHLAAVTKRILLGTGVIILPQRNPLVLAKQVASLDILSGGRVLLGIGAGYLEPEFRALGVPTTARGERTDEYLAAMRSLWTDPEPSFSGRHVSFDGVDAYPRPVQRPVPVVVGGRSPAALRRAARFADGWYGWMLSPSDVADSVSSLRALARTEGRTTALHISVTPNQRLNPDVMAAYGAAGADRLIVAGATDRDPRQILSSAKF